MELTKAWVEETAGMSVRLFRSAFYKFTCSIGKHLQGGPPAPTVYPDINNNLRPLVPAYANMKHPEMQKLLRAVLTKFWRKNYDLSADTLN